MAIGITKPGISGDGVICLNTYSLLLNLRHADLEPLHEKISYIPKLRALKLFCDLWNARVSRYEDSRIILDESPTIFKLFVRTHQGASTTIQANMTSRGTPISCFWRLIRIPIVRN